MLREDPFGHMCAHLVKISHILRGSFTLKILRGSLIAGDPPLFLKYRSHLH